jgi:hypothetical protein
MANGGDIRHAVQLPGGGTLRIETNGLMLDEVASKGSTRRRPTTASWPPRSASDRTARPSS